MPSYDPTSDTAHPHYAESVAMGAILEDATGEVGIRLGRFPPKRNATLWLKAHIDGRTFAVSESTPLGQGAGATRFDRKSVLYQEEGDFELHLERTGPHQLPFTGAAHAAAKAQLTADPVPGGGVIPIIVDLRFAAFHPPVQVKAERMEVFGMVEARVRTDTHEMNFSAPGKMHEQRGPRERFAPAFTYLSVVGREAGLLAVDHGGGPYGFAWMDGKVTPIESASFDPPGESRPFRVRLQDGRLIEGVAERVRASSAAIEGKRRPGSTVVVMSDYGRLVGHLNDWNPDP
jgi:hypothetical protein